VTEFNNKSLHIECDIKHLGLLLLFLAICSKPAGHLHFYSPKDKQELSA